MANTETFQAYFPDWGYIVPSKGELSMLSRDSKPTKLHGFLVAVEAEEGVDVKEIAYAIQGELTWKEGIGELSVDYLGDVGTDTPAEGMEGMEGHG